VNARGSVRRLLDLVAAEPGVTLARLVEVTGEDREHVMRTMRRYERGGHVSTDEIDGERCYWLEVAPGPTLQDRVLDRLARGPMSWGEIQEGIGKTGLSTAITLLERSGRIVIEQRTRPDGRHVAKRSIYRLAAVQ